MPAQRTLPEALQSFNDWIDQVQFRDYAFFIVQRKDCLYLQASFVERCIKKNTAEIQYTRQWMLHPDMTNSEFVQTALKLVLTSVEHEARENFQYRGLPIFGPHYNVDTLHSICNPSNMEHR